MLIWYYFLFRRKSAGIFKKIKNFSCVGNDVLNYKSWSKSIFNKVFENIIFSFVYDITFYFAGIRRKIFKISCVGNDVLNYKSWSKSNFNKVFENIKISLVYVITFYFVEIRRKSQETKHRFVAKKL